MKKIMFLLFTIFTILCLNSCGEISKCNHTWVLSNDKEPTCTEPGKKIFQCTICSEYTVEYTKQELGHNYGEVIIDSEPTCTESGKCHQECQRCGDILENSYASQLLHDYDEGVLVNPSCSVPGSYTQTCSRCGYQLIYEISQHGHNFDYSGEETEATCLEDGIIPGLACTICGYVFEEDTILPKLGHEYVSHICSRCDHVEEIEVQYYSDDTLVSTELIKYTELDSIPSSTPKENPTKENYEFVGWYINNKAIDKINDFIDSINNNIIKVQAKFFETKDIETVEDFLNISQTEEIKYYLKNDLDLNNMTIRPFNTFNGLIEGNNHSIKNFTISSTSIDGNYGLFKTNNGEINNIKFENFTSTINLQNNKVTTIGLITGVNNGTLNNLTLSSGTSSISYLMTNPKSSSVIYGNLVGVNNGHINNCSCDINTNVTLRSAANDSEGYGDKSYYISYYVGGLIGVNSGNVNASSFINNLNVESRLSGMTATGFVYFYYYVHSTNSVGGLIGRNNKNSIVSNSYTNTNITYNTTVLYNASDKVNIGGIVGENIGKASIKTSYSSGKITGGAKNGCNIGGFAGINDESAQIMSCYSTMNIKSGDVSNSASTFAGLVGLNDANIQNSYSLGSVTSHVNSITGGLVGENSYGGTISKCFASTDLSVSSGTTNKFVSKSSGILNRVYTINNTKFNTGNANVSNMNIETIDFSDLISIDFLANTLYWDEEGWYVGTDTYPFLLWEFEYSHNYSEVTIVEATCDTPGFTYYKCSDCDKLFLTDLVEPLGHTKKETIETIQPTHTEEGYELYKCEFGCTYKIIIPATGHDSLEEIKCTDENIKLVDGEYLYKCSCGEKLQIDSSDIIHKAYHTNYNAPSCGIYNEETNSYEGNPTTGVTQGSICEYCNVTLYGHDIIYPHDLVFKEHISLPTCHLEGYDLYQCTICDKDVKKTVDIISHSYSGTNLTCTVCNTSLFTIDETYQAISTFEDLLSINNNPSGNYYLTNDINLQGQTITTICDKDNPFTGILLGNGYKISNFVINSANKASDDVALFKYNNGIIAGLKIENVTINVTNNSISNVSILTVYNSGQILMCEITGTNTINLTASIVSTSTEAVIKGYNYTYGSFASTNNKNGIIKNSSVTGYMKMNYINESLLDSNSLKGYLSKLLTVTKVVNNVIITSGGICGINYGQINNTTFNPNLTRNTTSDSYTGGLSRGKTYLYLTLQDAGFVGINAGLIKNCKSISKDYSFHSKDEDCFIYNDPIMLNNVILKIEYEMVISNSIFEEYSGLIGKTQKNSVIENLECIG